MNTQVLESLNQHTAADLMSSELLTAYEGWSVKSLAGFFVKHNISAAPVIASDDSLVGVVSKSDVVKFESTEPSDSDIDKLIRRYCGPYGPELSPSEKNHIKERAKEHTTVNAIMTSKVLSINIDASAQEVCEMMIDKDIHRLFVINKERLVGVISSMDILRKVVGTL